MKKVSLTISIVNQAHRFASQSKCQTPRAVIEGDVKSYSYKELANMTVINLGAEPISYLL
jgi:hypothetical protein